MTSTGKRKKPPQGRNSSRTCDLCPLRDTGEDCPAWVTEQAGFTETNVVTKEERFVTGCFFQVIPKILSHTVAASNRAATASDKLRNSITKGFEALLLSKHLEEQDGVQTPFLEMNNTRKAIEGGKQTPDRD